MFPDFIDLLAILNKRKVKYLVIGGYAVATHAQPRVTKDLDIFVSPAPANARAVFKALAEFGAPLSTRTGPSDPTAPHRTLTPKDFEETSIRFTFGVQPVAVDILAEIPGVTFEAAWRNRTTRVIDDATSTTAHFMARDDLIAAKQAAGRKQDLADVEALQQAARAASSAPSTRGVKPKSPKPKARRKKKT